MFKSVLIGIVLAAVMKIEARLPDNYPPNYAIPPTISSVVAAVNLNGVASDPILTSCTVANQWALTYDDGPSTNTPTLLADLRAKNIKATFFVIGTQVQQFPAILKQIFDDGHEIALHSWSHPDFNTLTTEQIIMELSWNIKIVQDVIGERPRLFRPPFGRANIQVLGVISAMGLRAVTWDADTNDWQMATNPEFTEKRVLADVNSWLLRLPSKNILSLEHDLLAGTVAISVNISAIAVNSGAQLVKMSDCLGMPSYVDIVPITDTPIKISKTTSTGISSVTSTRSSEPTDLEPTSAANSRNYSPFVLFIWFLFHRFSSRCNCFSIF